MILPIFAYGQAVLKKISKPIAEMNDEYAGLISDMWETMYNASGVGLAAPQVGKSIRIFLVDTTQAFEEGEEEKGIKKVFINAEMIEEFGDDWSYEEGCLSIPFIRGDVLRPEGILIKYQDESMAWHEEEFDGVNARVIQHEYDHLEGILFTELLKPIKKRLIRKKLLHIKEGKIDADYKMKFARLR